ncbi:MAG: tetratricopeptide repeat protein [Desulfobacterales bacterium]
MLQKSQSGISHFKVLFIFFFICCGSGCSQNQQFQGFQINKGIYDSNNATLRKGHEAFQNEDYPKALEIYQRLSQLAGNAEIRRKALYGLACTRLILSENRKDLDEAIILWDAWSRIAPSELADEDPRMLEPLFSDRAILEKIKQKTSSGKQIDDNEDSSEMLKTRDDKILQLQKQLNIMENEVETLRHQIRSLEEIDQDIFEKKKDISTNSN